jgi:hypothetical protein
LAIEPFIYEKNLYEAYRSSAEPRSSAKKMFEKFLENAKSIKYLETPNYRNMLRFINADEYQIFILGHSCGLSDRTLLNTIFEHDNCKSIKLFYHKRPDGTDDWGDVTMNISRCFNDKAKLRERVVNKRDSNPLFIEV